MKFLLRLKFRNEISTTIDFTIELTDVSGSNINQQNWYQNKQQINKSFIYPVNNVCHQYVIMLHIITVCMNNITFEINNS